MDMGLSQEELLRVWDHIDQDSDGNITFEVSPRTPSPHPSPCFLSSKQSIFALQDS